MTQCLLFDNDGTLVDSERLCNIGLVIKFREYGIELDADELVLHYRGWKLTKIIDLISKQYNVKPLENFIPSYRKLVSDLFEKELQAVAGVEEALRNLPQPKAVVSNGPVDKIKNALRICGLADYFGENIFSAFAVNIWKPDPRLYLHAASVMGFQAEDCAVIDDGIVGVEAGHKAGMKTFFFNRFQQSCPYPGVSSFSDMKDLPGLIYHSNHSNYSDVP